MYLRKVAIVKDGAFWRVRLYHCGTWITLRGLYNTRRQARHAASIERII